MSGDVQLELRLNEYKMNALSSVLEEQGFCVEKRMQEMLEGLYVDLVPHEVRQEIQARIDAERTAWEAEREASRRYTVFRMRENSSELFFQMDRRKGLLSVGQFLRQYLASGQSPAAGVFQDAFPGLKPNSTVWRWRLMWKIPAKSPTCLIWILTSRRSPLLTSEGAGRRIR
jgi:hypothetical protein